MRLIIGAVLLAAAGVATTGAGGRAGAGAGNVVCPVTQTRARIAGFGNEFVGAGPVLLMELAGVRGSRISIAQSVPDKLGFRGQKTPWLVRDSYRGPLRIHAERIDKPGPVRFGTDFGQHLMQLSFSNVIAFSRVHGYYAILSETMFRAPGCYAYQIKGATFVERIVVKVAD